MYLLNCLLNLQFDKNFYPRLDIEKLYKILTTDNSLVLMQPWLAGTQNMESRLFIPKQLQEVTDQRRVERRLQKAVVTVRETNIKSG